MKGQQSTGFQHNRFFESSLFQALFMPYDHRNTTPNGLASEVMRSMLESINHHYCHDQCLVGSGGGSVGFVSTLLFIALIWTHQLKYSLEF